MKIENGFATQHAGRLANHVHVIKEIKQIH